MNELFEQGHSWSGRERNCCFLNTGDTRYANISACSGLDFIDDGRAVAYVDWDFDGQLDLWVANRTAPRLRFLRNDFDTGHHFLAIRLVGTRCNRDAIGARVELSLKERPGTKFSKSLRAGEGFRSQSTKWIHFGLGDLSEIERLVVRWPGGIAEEFAGLKADGRYTLTQGSGTAIPWTAPSGNVRLASSQQNSPPTTETPHILLAHPVPMPRLEFTDADGRSDSLSTYSGKPLLLNLWASWCSPCLTELIEFRQHQEQLHAAGLQIIALNVDGLSEGGSPDTDRAKQIFDQLKTAFICGTANAELLQKLQILHNRTIFRQANEFTLPTSFLIDSNGRLAAIYKGRVRVSRLLEDVDRLEIPTEQRLRELSPFPGRWHAIPTYVTQLKTRQLNGMAHDFLRAGFSADAETVSREALAINPNYADALFNLGTALLQQGQIVQASTQLSLALQINPAHVEAHINLGSALLRLRQANMAVDHFAAALAIKPEHPDAHNYLGLALVQQRKTSAAAEHFAEAVRIKSDYAEAHYNLGLAMAQLRQVSQAAEHFAEAARIKPDYAEAHNALGLALVQQGKLEDGLAHFAEAVRINPNYAEAQQNLRRYQGKTNF